MYNFNKRILKEREELYKVMSQPLPDRFKTRAVIWYGGRDIEFIDMDDKKFLIQYNPYKIKVVNSIYIKEAKSGDMIVNPETSKITECPNNLVGRNLYCVMDLHKGEYADYRNEKQQFMERRVTMGGSAYEFNDRFTIRDIESNEWRGVVDITLYLHGIILMDCVSSFGIYDFRGLVLEVEMCRRDILDKRLKRHKARWHKY